MPRCDGRPDGPCPLKVNNASVKGSQGELMLCRDCELYRFPYLKQAAKTSSNSAVTASVSAAAPSSTESAAAAQHVQPVIEQSTCTSELKLVVNEVLFFVHNKFDCMPKADIRSTVADFYREDEILAAKQILCQNMDPTLCQSETIQPLLKKKRTGVNKVDRIIDDIMNIFDAVDVTGARGLLPVFCAASLSRVPIILDESTELSVIKAELSALKQQVNILVSSIAHSFPEHTEPSTSLQTRSTSSQDTMTLPSASSEIVSDPPVSYSAAAKSVNNSTLEGAANSKGASGSSVLRSTHSYEVDDDGFQRVTGRRDRNKRKQKLIIGCRPCTDSVSFHGVKKKAVVCVSRLDKNASVDAVTQLLTSNDITVHSCFSVGRSAKTTVNDTDSEASDTVHNSESSASQDAQLRDKHRYYNSMRICVYHSDLDKVMCPELWPDGVCVRPWVFKAKHSELGQ